MNDYARRRILSNRIDQTYGVTDRRRSDYRYDSMDTYDSRDMYDGEDYRRGVRGSGRRDRAESMDMFDGHGPEVELTKHDMME
jgi:hypothetical protein